MHAPSAASASGHGPRVNDSRDTMASRERGSRMRRLLPLLALLTVLAALSPALAQNDRQLLYGGAEGDVYLGCLSCSRYEADSVTNEHGRYGSEHGYASIHNAHGIYGSRYAVTSVCNPHATRPPRIVTARGTDLGHLTLNPYLEHAIDEEGVLRWLRDDVCD